jgi:hypothetical protein
MNETVLPPAEMRDIYMQRASETPDAQERAWNVRQARDLNREHVRAQVAAEKKRRRKIATASRRNNRQ